MTTIKIGIAYGGKQANGINAILSMAARHGKSLSLEARGRSWLRENAIPVASHCDYTKTISASHTEYILVARGIASRWPRLQSHGHRFTSIKATPRHFITVLRDPFCDNYNFSAHRILSLRVFACNGGRHENRFCMRNF